MSIPPIAEFSVFGNIFPPDVKASHVANSVIYNYDFPMISIVDPKLQTSHNRREKDSHLNAIVLKDLPFGFSHKTTAHSVAEDSNLNPCLCPLNENGDDGIKHFIILYDIILEMNKVGGTGKLHS